MKCWTPSPSAFSSPISLREGLLDRGGGGYHQLASAQAAPAPSPPPRMHLGPTVVSSSSLFAASVQRQMTAVISLRVLITRAAQGKEASAGQTQPHYPALE